MYVTIRLPRETFERVLNLAAELISLTPDPNGNGEDDLQEHLDNVKAVSDMDREVILAVVNENREPAAPPETI